MARSRGPRRQHRDDSRREHYRPRRQGRFAQIIPIVVCFLGGAGLMAIFHPDNLSSSAVSDSDRPGSLRQKEYPESPVPENLRNRFSADARSPGVRPSRRSQKDQRQSDAEDSWEHDTDDLDRAYPLIASLDEESSRDFAGGPLRQASLQEGTAEGNPVPMPVPASPPVPSASFSGNVIPQPAGRQPRQNPSMTGMEMAGPGGANVLPPGNNDDRRISFNFGGAPWSAVLQKLAEEAGYALEIKSNPPGTFSYSDSSTHSVAEAIDIVNGFLIREGFVLIRHGRLMMVVGVEDIPSHLVEQLEEADLPERGRFELVAVEIPVTEVSAQDMATELQPLMTKLGKIVPVASANRLVVSDLRERLQQILKLIHTGDLETASIRSEVVTLKNTNADDVVKSLQQMMGNAVAVASGATGNAARTSSATSGPPVVSVVETNCIIIRGREQSLRKIRELIADLDRLPAQVHIQAMLVEVELSDTDEFGVELGVQDSLLFRRSIVDDVLTVTESRSDPATGIVTTTQRIINQTTNPGFNFNNAPMGNNTSQGPGRFAGQALSSLSVGRMNPDEGYGGLVLAAGNESLSVLLRALKANREVNILSRPTIRTVHNRKASIQMGAQVPVVDGVTMSPTGTANPVVRQDKSGIILEVTPKISETGVIFLDVKAEKSEFRTGPGSGTPIFTDGTNGNVIEAPIKDVTEAIATVNITSGQTVVLGGMITAGEVESMRKIPIIGDWPLVGPLFRYEYVANRRKELLIFLTPEIIYSDDDARRISQRELEMSKIDMNMLAPAIACPPDMMPQDSVLFEEAQPPAPGFKPAEDWYVPTFRKWGDPNPEQMPPMDRATQIGTFLNGNAPVGAGHSYMMSPGVPAGPGAGGNSLMMPIPDDSVPPPPEPPLPTTRVPDVPAPGLIVPGGAP